MRANSSDSKVYYPFVQQGFRFQSMDWAPVTAEAIDSDAPTLLIMRPAGAVSLKMPAVSTTPKGLAFFIINKSAFVITLQTAAGGAFTNAIAIAANQSGWVVCTGDTSSADALGWYAHVSAGTQTSP
jgi:hypothetical protein